MLRQYFPQSVVNGPAPPWLLEQRHVKVSFPDFYCSQGHTSEFLSLTPGVGGEGGREPQWATQKGQESLQ